MNIKLEEIQKNSQIVMRTHRLYYNDNSKNDRSNLILNKNKKSSLLEDVKVKKNLKETNKLMIV